MWRVVSGEWRVKRWDGVEPTGDASRFRVRVIDGATETRALEVEGAVATYLASDVVADFPGGVGEAARIAVAQWGEGYGWGTEATVRLIA